MTESKIELERKVEALETHLAELKRRLKAVESAEQHDAINYLDEYLQEVDHEYDDIRAFWPEVLKELRALVGK